MSGLDSLAGTAAFFTNRGPNDTTDFYMIRDQGMSGAGFGEGNPKRFAPRGLGFNLTFTRAKFAVIPIRFKPRPTRAFDKSLEAPLITRTTGLVLVIGPGKRHGLTFITNKFNIHLNTS